MSKVNAIDGLPVVDAKRPLTLKVTKADIVRAAENIKEPHNCAVARACKRDLHVIEARVHLARIYLRTNNHNWVRYFTPRDMRGEIIAFDRGGQFEAGEFVLTPLQPSKRLGADKRKRTGVRSGKNKKRRPYHALTNVRGGPATQS